jgi:16S rRNA processing protein RimM
MGAQHRMAMSDKARPVLLGRICGPHGIRGNVVIETYTGEPKDIAAYGPLQTEDGARQLDVSIVRITPKGVIAHVEGVGDRNNAEALKGLKLYVDRDRLPAARTGEFYQTDLVGLKAEDPSGNHIGIIAAVQNYGAGDLLEIRLEGKRRTELVPFADAFVLLVDVDSGRIIVALPSGKPETD